MITRNLLSILALGVAGAAVACGSSGEPEELASTEEVGSLGLKLQVGGVTLSSFHYVITGPGGFVRQADVSIGSSSTLATLVGGLPVGTGFTVALVAAAPGNALACNGSAGFDVVARQTTAVTVRLQCREPSRSGSVQVNGTLNQCPSIDSLSATPAAVLVGNQLSLSAVAHDSDASPQALAYAWTASSGTLTGATTPEAKLTCVTAGDVLVTLNVTDGDCSDTQTATVSCTTPAGGGAVAKVVVNEVESNGGVPGDWVELTNVGTAVADISGWKFKDNDDTHAFYAVPAGTLLAPGAFYVLEEAQFGFGLGGADSARLWDAAGVLVDSYSWTAHATVTYGRCPVGASFGFVQTPSSKGAANDCSSSGGSGGSGGSSGSGGAGSVGGSAGTAAGGTGGTGSGSGGAGGSGSSGGSGGSGGSVQAWPGTEAVATVDEAGFFGTNMSGLSYQPAAAGAPAVLWAVQNSPSKLFRLLYNGVSWVPDAENGWGNGKLMHYANGTGAPDSEGVTQPSWASPAMYVATERDNNNNGVSRLVILRVDAAATGADLTATNEWNVTADLPVVGPNLGLEGITFVPDTALVAGGFIDELTHAPYDPSLYPNHAGGLFFVGVEGNGNVYAYALDHVSNAFARVATISSGQVNIMDLSYDRETNLLWGWHDNTTAANKATVFRLDQAAGSPTSGTFQIARVFDHPATLPNANNEGIAFGSEADCVAGQKPFFWSDDDNTGSHAIRRGSVACGVFF